jgi:hypothetical protein
LRTFRQNDGSSGHILYDAITLGFMHLDDWRKYTKANRREEENGEEKHR